MRVGRVWLLGVTIVVVALAAAAGWAASAAVPTVSSNRASAVRDARGLLARVALPVRAVRLARDPVGPEVFSSPAPLPDTPDFTDLHAWWRVPGQPTSVLGYIGAHTRHPATGIASQFWAGGRWSQLQFEFPPVPGVLFIRSLVVTVTGLGDGFTAVRADAEVAWVIPRPPGEQIPAGVSEVDVMRGRPGHQPVVSVTVTDPATVATIVMLVNSLQTAQPTLGVSCLYRQPCLSCGADSPVVTFSFRVERGGPIIAHTTQPASANEPMACDLMRLTLRGRPQTPLVGGAAVVRNVQRLLKVKLVVTP